MKVCIIDVGTNSLHAIYAEMHGSGSYHVIDKQKEMIRLGDGALLSSRLSQASQEAAIVVLRRFISLAQHHDVSTTVAVATSAVREASNGGVFIDRVRKQLGLRIRIITGAEEGRLIYLAVKHHFDFMGKTGLIVDIGGGSTEFILAKKKTAVWIESLKLGTNRLHQMFPLSDPPQKEEIRKLEAHVALTGEGLLAKLRKRPPAYLVGTSGTLLNLASMILLKKNDRLPDNFKDIAVSLDDIEKMYGELCALTLGERLKVKGLDAKRADMVIHGVALVYWIMREAKIRQLYLCEKALREGLLYDFMDRNRRRLKIEDNIPDVRQREVVSLATRCRYDCKHAEYVSRLALRLFDLCQEFHRLTRLDRELLHYSALLHDIGYLVSPQKHHRHAYYLIRNSDWLGFTGDEVEVMAWVARLHRRFSPKKIKDDFKELSPEMKRRVVCLGAMLSIADGLDKSHFGLIKDIRMSAEKNKIIFKVYASSDIEFELYEASQRKELFEKTFGKTVQFEMRRVPHD